MLKKKNIIVLALTFTLLLAGCQNQKTESQTDSNSSSETLSDVPATITYVTETDPTEPTSSETTTPKPVETTTTTAVTTATTPKPVETTVTTTTTKPSETTTPKPVAEWTETEYKATMYVNTSCYSRKKAIIGADKVKLYNVNDAVGVVAKTSTSYYKLDTGAFIHFDYLSLNKVTPPSTTTTTTQKPSTPAPKPQQTFTVWAKHIEDNDKGILNSIYSDEDCTDSIGCKQHASTLEVVETIKSKNVYKAKADDNIKRYQGLDYVYLKMSDWSTTEIKIDDMFCAPFTDAKIEKIRQYIINDAVNNCGLVHRPEVHNDENNQDDNFCGTWGVPLDISNTYGSALLERNVHDLAKANFDVYGMRKGDYFNVYVEFHPKAGFDYNTNQPVDVWRLKFLRGHRIVN